MNDAEKLKKAHDDNGDCRSCGWHAALYEMDYEPTGRIIEDCREWLGYCRSENDEDCSSHRGCYIYTSIEHD